MINIGIIGFGYWGPNVARNFNICSGAKLAAICDTNEGRLKIAKAAYPFVKIYPDPSALINSDEIRAVAIVTPVFSHYELAKAALESGKHIFIEKPFTSNVRQAEELIDLARKNGPHHHGRSHVLIYRRRKKNPRSHRFRRIGRSFLL